MEFVSQIGTSTGAFLSTLLAFLVVLTIVVFVHEFGHFIVGRLCGVGVTDFSIGFGPELFGWNDRRGTRWKVCAIPLGGYVKFVGDVNAASVPDVEALDQLTPAERAVSFPHKSIAQRAAVVAAGPIANFLLAIVVFAGLNYAVGRQIIEPRIETVQVGSVAEQAGFRPGDLVTAIDGRRIDSFSDMQRVVSGSPDEELTFTVDRNGKVVTLVAVPALKEQTTPFGKHRIGMLGVGASQDPAAVRRVPYSALGALTSGVSETWFVIDRTFFTIGRLIVGRESLDQVAGPVGIFQAAGQVASNGGIGGLLAFVAVLSVSIGLFNLFPIPLLDGGHLLYYAAEAIRGRPLSNRVQEIGFRIGLAIVAILMIFATSNDIFHRI